MSIYFVGIDIAKYKHNCCIISSSDQSIVSSFAFSNDKIGFNQFLSSVQSLKEQREIRIGFESTAHYTLNLKLFLEKANHSFMEVHPILINEFQKSTTLRRTKTDIVDSEAIARWLMSVEYKPLSKGFYHSYSLKSLTRLRDRLVRQRSFYIVKITNVLDHTFPEFKSFFNDKFSKTAIYLLENYGSAEKMARMKSTSYEKLRSVSRGKFSPQQFLELKKLATDTVGVNNHIFDMELISLLRLYQNLDEEINLLENEIEVLIRSINPHFMTIPGIGEISAAVIYAEYGDISNFSSPNQMLAFAGLEPSIRESGEQKNNRGKMVKRGSSYLRYTILNCCLPLIQYNLTFATYYAKKRAEGKNHMVAQSHVAKKLIRVIFALERQKVDFEPTLLR